MKIIVSYEYSNQITENHWKLLNKAKEFDISTTLQQILDIFQVTDISELRFSSVLEVKDGSTS